MQTIQSFRRNDERNLYFLFCFRCRNFQIDVEQRRVGILESRSHGQFVRRFRSTAAGSRSVPVGAARPSAPGIRTTTVHIADAESASGAPDTRRSQQQVIAEQIGTLKSLQAASVHVYNVQSTWYIIIICKIYTWCARPPIAYYII